MLACVVLGVHSFGGFFFRVSQLLTCCRKETRNRLLTCCGWTRKRRGREVKGGEDGGGALVGGAGKRGGERGEGREAYDEKMGDVMLG